MTTEPETQEVEESEWIPYEEQLQDPRWQQRRIEIYKRDKFECQLCGHYFHNLCVHHIRYTGFAWDAPAKDLITLCGKCHSRVHHKTGFFFIEYGPGRPAKSSGEVLPVVLKAIIENSAKLNAMAHDAGPA